MKSCTYVVSDSCKLYKLYEELLVMWLRYLMAWHEFRLAKQ